MAILTLAACGSGGTKTVVVTRVARTGTATGGATTPTVPTTPTTVTATLPRLPVPGTKTGTVKTVTRLTRSVHLANFRSPTGNIGCVMLDGTARCDISQRAWKPPPRPASCSKEVDFGQGLEVGHTGKATFVCAGDTALDATGTPLPYGEQSVEGDFACLSEETGMACRDETNGHGFFISRQRYRVF